MIRILIYAMVFAAEAAIAWIYCNNIYVHTKDTKIVFLSFLFGYILLFIVSQQTSVWLNTGLFFAVNMVLLRMNFSCKIKSSVFHSAFLTIIMSASELLVNLMIASIVEDYNAYMYRVSAFATLFVFSKLLYFLVAVFSAKVFMSKFVGQNDSGNMILLCVVPGISLVIVVTFVFIGISGQLTELTETLISASAVALLVANIAIIFIYNRIQILNEEKTNLQLSIMRDRADTAYYELLQRQYDGQRMLIHNIKNHLNVICMNAEIGDTAGIINYIAEIQSVPELNLRTKLCKNPILNMILLDYWDECVEKGIGFAYDIRVEDISFMGDMDITALFANLLSNAVEAAQKTQEKSISMSISKKEEQGYIFISVVNSCDFAPIIDGKGRFKSRKGNDYMHGYGTKSIARVVKKYKGTSKLYYESTERQFHADVIFPI